YYVPREELIEKAYTQLLGEDPDIGGHYITVWAPRQTGKTWVMGQTLYRLKRKTEFDTVKINLQDFKGLSTNEVFREIAKELEWALGRSLPSTNDSRAFTYLFSEEVLDKPLILILDEFDIFEPETIDAIANVFRNIYIARNEQADKHTTEKRYLLHGVALIGVRSVLGVENVKGSPFNVQRSVKIPNLTYAEVKSMFDWYTRETGQVVAQEALDQLYYEMSGQPGLTSWMGELLTETYNDNPNTPITARSFEIAYAAATKVLPNNNILNIISKANDPEYRPTVLEFFRTQAPVPFTYDDRHLNYLYTNGVIDQQKVNETEYRVKFANPFVQKRLFNFFARDLFGNLGVLHDPFLDLDDTITDDSLNVTKLSRHYEAYVQLYRDNLFRNVPRRATDERVYEAIYHFSFYRYLTDFLYSYESRVLPEFPTGNGKVDLLIEHGGRIYPIEVKSFANRREYRKAQTQAAEYAQQLKLDHIALVFFVEKIDEKQRQELEVNHIDAETGVTVEVVFIATG
ncbi:MAG: AAA-like domain-containing protein, partial [Chloroflexota bacterium]